MTLAKRKRGRLDAAWSDDLNTASAVFGQAAQIQIIRFLQINGPSTRHHVADGLGLNHGYTTQCLNKLTDAGAVAVDSALNQGDHPTRFFTVDSDRVELVFGILARYLDAAPGEELGSGT